MPASAQEAAARAGATPVSDPKDSTNSEFHAVSRIIRADIIEVESVGPVQMIGIETPDGKTPAEIYDLMVERPANSHESALLRKERSSRVRSINAASG